MTIDITDPPTLFDSFYPQRELTLKEKFCIFHLNNPQVYKALVEMTQEMVNRGRTKLSIATLVENLRWNYYLTTDDPNSEFKVNNSYRAHYSRLLMDEHPEFGNIFELREVHDQSAILVRH